MSAPGWIILAIVVVALLIVLALMVRSLRGQRRAMRADRATALRHQAETKPPDPYSSREAADLRRQADELDPDAER